MKSKERLYVILTAYSLILAFSGCASLPVPSRHGVKTPLPEKLATYYDYTSVKLTAQTNSTQEADGYKIRKMVLTLRQAQGERSTEDFRPTKIDWYQPVTPNRRSGLNLTYGAQEHRPGFQPEAGPPSVENPAYGNRTPQRLPTILISPILAGNDLYINEFARFFASKGMNAVIIYRPKEVFSGDRPLSDIEKHFKESVIQMRRVLDWLETQETVDPQRVGSFAISMGAILTTLLSTVEPRVKASVLGLPGGRIAETLMASQDKAIRKRRNNYLKENNVTHEEVLEQLKVEILSEPMVFASGLNPDRIMMVTGLFDRVLGFKRSMALWWAMGRPKLVLLPTGHYTSAFATPGLKISSYSFLKRKLK